MIELLPKPKRSDYPGFGVNSRLFFSEAELAYYKRLSEFAIDALHDITDLSSTDSCDAARDAHIIAYDALSAIKRSEQL